MNNLLRMRHSGRLLTAEGMESAGVRPALLRTGVRQDGFTLTELLVVLSIIGLLATIMTSSLFRKPAYLARERIAADLGAQMTAAAAQAHMSGKVVALDLAKEGEAITFAPAVGNAGAPLFYPDGSSNGGSVRANGGPLFEIGWLDGRVRRAAR